MVLNIYTANGTLIGTFGGNDAVLISEEQLALQQGNGNSVFDLGLTDGTGGTGNEQAEFDAMLALLPPGTQIFAGLAASFGCTPAPCVIGASNDGAESFIAFRQDQVAAVPGPIVGAGLPGLITACMMMLGLGRYRRNKQLAA